MSYRIVHTKIVRCNMTDGKETMQHCIQILSITIVLTKVVNCKSVQTKVVNCYNAYKSCHLQLCIQNLSFAMFAYKSYHSLDNIFLNTLWLVFIVCNF